MSKHQYVVQYDLSFGSDGGSWEDEVGITWEFNAADQAAEQRAWHGAVAQLKYCDGFEAGQESPLPHRIVRREIIDLPMEV